MTQHPIHYEIFLATRYWVRHGSKKHRQKQVRRMHILADFALTRGARHIGQIGPRTLRAFQKAMNYTDSTMQCYRQALQNLLKLLVQNRNNSLKRT